MIEIKIRQDLEESRHLLKMCRKFSDKWKFYRDHIEYLENQLKK